MSRRPSRILLALLAGAGLSVSIGAAPLRPEGQPQPTPVTPPVAQSAKQDAHAAPQDRPTFRERMRERCSRLLIEMRDDQGKLEEAMKKLDSGSSFDEIRGILPERLAARFRSNNDAGPPDANDSGPRRGGDRFGDRFGANSNQPFNDEDWEAVNAIIKHAQPEMLDKFNELRQKDAEQAQKSMLSAYPRLRPLLELYKHDRTAFDLRLEELVILRKSLPLAKEVIDLKKSGKADDSAEVKAAREKLRDLGTRHHENRLKIQQHEIEMMGQRMQKRQKDLEEQIASPERFIDRSIDGLIKQAERGGFDAPPDRKGGPPEGPPDGPRRRPNPDDGKN